MSDNTNKHWTDGLDCRPEWIRVVKIYEMNPDILSTDDLKELGKSSDEHWTEVALEIAIKRLRQFERFISNLG
jgi:hypothetical protein